MVKYIHYPFEFVYTKEIEEFFKQNLIFLQSVDKIEGVIPYGKKIKIHHPIRLERFSAIPNGNFLSIGSFSYCQSQLPQSTSIGKYCSISWDVVALSTEHPTEWVTSHLFAFREYYQDAAFKHLGKKGRAYWYERAGHFPIFIGNDVWIGQSVLIRGGVSIGNGAIVGGGSTITKDVPAYAIVAGNPARVIRYRFSDSIIEKLQSISWWNYYFADFSEMDIRDPERFISDFEAAIEQNSIKPFESRPFDLVEAICQLEPKPE